jgi:ParB family chromosome partitioning protein
VSNPRRIGLPTTVRMRHDTHFVDQLVRPSGESIGQVVPLEEIAPNPDQPRQNLGDLSELVASIREKGVLEPLLVRKVGGRFQIIAGERRYRAALEADLDEVPCIVREASDAEVMEIALIENLQRKYLTPFEEADGLKALAENYNYTHEMMAQKLGKSRSSMTEMLSLTAMPDDIRELCRLADIHSKSVLLQIVRQGDSRKMMSFLERLQQEGTTRVEARRLTRAGSEKKTRGRPKNYVFKYEPKGQGIALSLKFKRAQVEREEVIEALEGILATLRHERD